MGEQSRAPFLPGLLAVAAVTEFLLLRTGTRTLIHIPGLERIEAPIRVVAEVGRFVYYLAVVLVVATLVSMALRQVRSGEARKLVTGSLLICFLALATTGRLGLVSAALVGWISLGLLAGFVALTWHGLRWAPIGLFTLSSVAAGWSVLGQGDGGGLSGPAVDTLILAAEVLLVLAALTSPLLVWQRLTPASVTAGGVATVVVAAAFSAGGSTLSIIVLWNIGVPGWVPGIAYALAIGALTTAVWLSMSSGKPMISIGMVLLIAGGVGVISTYQTGLVFAALALFDQSAHLEDSLSSRVSRAPVPVHDAPPAKTVSIAGR